MKIWDHFFWKKNQIQQSVICRDIGLIFTFLIAIIFFTCGSPKKLSEKRGLRGQWKKDQCYFSKFISEDKKQAGSFYSEGFILKIQEPEFETVRKSITDEEIKKNQIDEKWTQVKKWDSYWEYSLYNFIPYGVMICKKNYPSVLDKITIQTLKDQGNSYEFDKIKTHARLIKIPTANKPAPPYRDQFYFKKGWYSKFKKSPKIALPLEND